MASKLHTMVTGEPRSGTSLMMLLLREMGLDIVGEKYPQQEHEDLDERQREEAQQQFEQMKKMNPNGFWEIPGTVVKGLKNVPDSLDDKCIKIVSSGAYPQVSGNFIYGTPPEAYERAIFCARNPRAIAESQRNLKTGVETPSEDGKWSQARFITNPQVFVSRTGPFLIWLAKQDQSVREKYIINDFDSLIETPDQQVRRICDHIGVPFQRPGVIEPSLRRSKLDSWPEQMIEVGRLADQLYSYLLDCNWDGILAWEVEIQDFMERNRLESQKWVDTEWSTYRVITPTLWRNLRDNLRNVRDNLLENSVFHNYTESTYFEGRTGEEYTIERPADMGDLTRQKVKCNHPKYPDVMTHERFRELWINEWGRM